MPRDLIPSNVRDFAEEQLTTDTQWDTEQDEEHYLAKAREYVLLREQKARIEAVEKSVKAEVMEALANFGLPYGASGQHRTINFPGPIRGVLRLVRQAKVITTIDPIKGEAIARQKGLYERLFKPVMTLDQDALMVAVQEGLITESELEQIVVKNTVYALTVEKK